MKKWYVWFIKNEHEILLEVDGVSQTDATAKAYEVMQEEVKDVNTWQFSDISAKPII